MNFFIKFTFLEDIHVEVATRQLGLQILGICVSDMNIEIISKALGQINNHS